MKLKLMSTPLPPVLVVDDEKNMRRVAADGAGRTRAMPSRAVESAEEGLALLGQRGIFHGHHRRPPGGHERL